MGDRKTIQKRLQRARWRVGRDYKQHEAALTKAAEFYGLDPNKPNERDQLIYTLADACFGPDGKKGRREGSRTSWGYRRLVALRRLYEEIKDKNPNLSDAKIAKLIKEGRGDFKNDDAEQIRQRLREARCAYENEQDEASDALLDAAHAAYVEEARADYIAEHGKEPDEDWEPEPPEPEWDD